MKHFKNYLGQYFLLLTVFLHNLLTLSIIFHKNCLKNITTMYKKKVASFYQKETSSESDYQELSLIYRDGKWVEPTSSSDDTRQVFNYLTKNICTMFQNLK